MTDSGTMQLVDGSSPANAQNLFDRLRALGIHVTTIKHPRVFTVEQSKALRGKIPGCHTKNLLLRNKKGVMWLIVCLENRTVNLKSLATCLGAGRFSFASPERLERYLGVEPGAVSPFAVTNDHTQKVRIAVDQELLRHETLNFHPLDNSMTTLINSEDFLRFLESEGHTPEIVDFDKCFLNGDRTEK